MSTVKSYVKSSEHIWLQRLGIFCFCNGMVYLSQSDRLIVSSMLFEFGWIEENYLPDASKDHGVLEQSARQVALGKRTVVLMDSYFGELAKVRRQIVNYPNVSILMIDSSVFLYNKLRLLSMWQHSLDRSSFVDISTSHRKPKIMSDKDASIMRAEISKWVSDHLLASMTCTFAETEPPHVDEESFLNMVCIAGALLEYPVIYTCITQRNDLGGVPLLLCSTNSFAFSVPETIYHENRNVRVAMKQFECMYGPCVLSIFQRDLIAV